MIKSIVLGALLFLCVYGIVLFFNKRRMEKQLEQQSKHVNEPKKIGNRRR
ncbi:MAG: hypothetical protein Q4G28_02175 [Neisseria sp.]|nr:hypothetical protein [Neisseria sp.]